MANVKVLRPFSDTVTFAWASQNSRIYIVHSNMAPKLYEIAKHTTEDSYCWVKSRLRREIKVESSSVKWVSNSLLVISHQSHSHHSYTTLQIILRRTVLLFNFFSCLSTFDFYLFWCMMFGIYMFLITLNIQPKPWQWGCGDIFIGMLL